MELKHYFVISINKKKTAALNYI